MQPADCKVRCAGGMAHRAPLAELLEGSRDLASRILALVGLQGLAGLECTSRGLRAAVAQGSDSLWQASCVPAG